MTEKTENLPRIRLGLLFILLCFINGEMDGWPRFLSPANLQRLLLPYTLAFLAICYLFFHPEIVAAWLERRGVQWLPTWRMTLRGASFFVAMAAIVFVVEAKYYSRFGYHLHPVPTILVFGSAFLALLIASHYHEIKPLHLLFIVLGCFIAIELLSFFSFPVVVQRSDMLPMLQAPGKVLLSGHNPYRYYVWPNETEFCSYLPGNIIAYLPATWLRFDLRFISLAYMLIGSVLIYREAATACRREVAALLSLFLLGNFLIYRHETYLQDHWLSLIVFAVLLSRGKVVWAAVALGVSVAISQLSLAIFPFVVLHALQRDGWKKAAATCAAGIGSALAIVGPFILWSPKLIYFGVFGQYFMLHSVNARPMNLGYWVAHVMQPSDLKWCQLGVLVCLFFYCLFRRRCRDAAGCLQWMAIAFLAFILLNTLLDGYFYLTLAMLLLLFLCIKNGYWRVQVRGQETAAA